MLLSYMVGKCWFSCKQNYVLAADGENVKSLRWDSVSTSKRQSSQKQQTNTSNVSSSISSEYANIPSIEKPTTAGCHTASEKYFPSSNNGKKDTQDPQSLPNRQPSQKQQPNTANQNSSKSPGSNNVLSSEVSAEVGRTASSKKSSSRPEVSIYILQNLDCVWRSFGLEASCIFS